MAGRIMQLALEIRGRLDGSVTSSMQRQVSSLLLVTTGVLALLLMRLVLT